VCACVLGTKNLSEISPGSAVGQVCSRVCVCVLGTKNLSEISPGSAVGQVCPCVCVSSVLRTSLRSVRVAQSVRCVCVCVVGTKNLSEILSDRENISHFMQVLLSVVSNFRHCS